MVFFLEVHRINVKQQSTNHSGTTMQIRLRDKPHFMLTHSLHTPSITKLSPTLKTNLYIYIPFPHFFHPQTRNYYFELRHGCHHRHRHVILFWHPPQQPDNLKQRKIPRAPQLRQKEGGGAATEEKGSESETLRRPAGVVS